MQLLQDNIQKCYGDIEELLRDNFGVMMDILQGYYGGIVELLRSMLFYYRVIRSVGFILWKSYGNRVG